jgi:dienelactone hydrolase
MGDDDEANPAIHCAEYAAMQLGPSNKLEIKLYPGAAHAFDVVGEPRAPTGFVMAFDAAAADSYATDAPIPGRAPQVTARS